MPWFKPFARNRNRNIRGKHLWKDGLHLTKEGKIILALTLCLNKATSSDCNETRTHNHLVCKRTLNHLAQLAKLLSCVVSTYLYGAFDWNKATSNYFLDYNFFDKRMHLPFVKIWRKIFLKKQIYNTYKKTD